MEEQAAAWAKIRESRRARSSAAVLPGLMADSMAVDGDPLADVGVLDPVRLVMKGDEVAKGQ